MLTWSANVRGARVVSFHDEDALVLAAVRRILRHETYDVVTATEPREILELSRKVKLSVLAVEAGGLRLLRQVRATSPETRGVLLTAGNDLPRVADAVNDGTLCRLIRVPWEDGEFRRTLRAILEEPGEAPKNPRPPEERRAVLRLRCRDRTTGDLLREVRENADSRPVIVLEDLFRLMGSIPELLTGLAESTRGSSIVDGTGCMNLVLDCYSRRVPLVVYGSERDVPVPKRILFVGKPGGSSSFTRELLESAGHQCSCVSSLRDAAEAFDLVLLDSSLAEEKAIDLMEEVLDRGWRVPILTVAAFPAPDAAEPCLSRELLHAIEGGPP